MKSSGRKPLSLLAARQTAEVLRPIENVSVELSGIANGRYSLSELSSHAEKLRSLAKTGECLDESERMKIMVAASKIDQMVSALPAGSVRKGGG